MIARPEALRCPDPNKHLIRLSIHLCHELDLVITFLNIVLIDTDLICPNVL
jgi:hypothetical protein